MGDGSVTAQVSLECIEVLVIQQLYEQALCQVFAVNVRLAPHIEMMRKLFHLTLNGFRI